MTTPPVHIDEPAEPTLLAVYIRQLPLGGFVIAEHGEEVAAFSTMTEVARWLQTRVPLQPGLPRAVDLGPRDGDDPGDLPRVVQSEQQRGFFPRRRT